MLVSQATSIISLGVKDSEIFQMVFCLQPVANVTDVYILDHIWVYQNAGCKSITMASIKPYITGCLSQGCIGCAVNARLVHENKAITMSNYKCACEVVCANYDTDINCINLLDQLG